MVQVGSGIGRQHFHKPHWHDSKEEAVKQANKMVASKIKSLEKQLVELKEMKF